MTAPRRPATDPAAAARAIVGELGQVAVGGGRPELRERLERELARWGAAGVTIVLAGETGSGKSTLINAMLGQPELLPVAGEGASTAVPVVIRHAPQLSVRVHTLGGGPTDASLDAARDWISQAGNPGNRRGVQAVEIGLSHSLLARGLTLVDTPGVEAGGSGDVDGTLASLNWADALLFVTSARAPISSHELAFLARALERVETVIVVISKTDAYPGWREVLAQDETTLAGLPTARVPSPIPISSRLRHLAERTRRDGDDEFAKELVADSGFPDLAVALDQRVAGRARDLRLANLLRLADTVVNAIELPDRAVLAAADDDPGAVDALAVANARLAELGKATTAAASRVHDALELARLDLTQRTNNALGELQRKGEAKAASVASDADLGTLADELTSGLAEVTSTLAAGFSDRVALVMDELAAAYDAALAPLPQPDAAAPGVRVAEPGPAPSRGAYGAIRTHYYPFLMGSGVVGTLGTAATAVVGVVAGAGAVAAAPLVAPIALASLAAGGVSVLLSRRGADRDALRVRARETVRQVVADARTDLGAWLTRAVLETRRAIQDGIREQLEAQADDLRRTTEAQQRTLKGDRASRKRARDAAAARLDQLRAIRARSDAIRAAITREPRPGT